MSIMKIKNLTIKNFKCFSETANVEFGKITLLTGANSSGKSSLIYSLLGLLQSSNSPITFSPNGKYVNMGDYKEVIYNHNLDLNLTINILCDDSDIKEIQTEWTIDKSNNQPKLFALIVEHKDYTLYVKLNSKSRYHVTLKYNQKDQEKQELFDTIYDILFKYTIDELPEKFKANIDEIKTKIIHTDFEVDDLLNISLLNTQKGRSKLTMLIRSLINEFDHYKSSINYISSFRLQPERTNIELNQYKSLVDVNGDGYLDQILFWYTYRKDIFKVLKKTLKKIGLAHDIKAKRLTGGRYEINVKPTTSGVFASLCDVGFGIPQVLPMVVADMQLGLASTLVVSQPEIHLHPSIQAKLGDYFVEQTTLLDKNYVIETHSEYLLNRIRLNIVKGKISPEDVKIYHIANIDNHPKLYHLKFTEDGQILDAPKDFFETYMLDVMNIAIESTR